MENSPKIGKAISDYLNNSGKRICDIAEAVKVSHSTVVYWRSGHNKEIRNLHWIKLQSIIQDYLPKDLQPREIIKNMELTSEAKKVNVLNSIELDVLNLISKNSEFAPILIDVIKIIKKYQ